MFNFFDFLSCLRILLKGFLPEYEKYGRAAPLRRNMEIISYADVVVALWDGESRGTKFVIDNCLKNRVSVSVVFVDIGV